MNITESKYYIYSQNGQLVRRVEFSEYIGFKEQILTTSPNGHIFVIGTPDQSESIRIMKIGIFEMKEVTTNAIAEMLANEFPSRAFYYIIKSSEKKIQRTTSTHKTIERKTSMA